MRSINLERDCENIDLLSDYVVTERADHALDRIVSGVSHGSAISWAMTGVYGTGKSSFAQFLLSLFSSNRRVRHVAESRLDGSRSRELRIEQKQAWASLRKMLFAVSTAQREPIALTVLRALENALNNNSTDRTSEGDVLLRKVRRYIRECDENTSIPSRKIVDLVIEASKNTDAGLFFVIDELGKPLEYAAFDRDRSDIYLLQQICELSAKDAKPVYVLGILHHAFSEYTRDLGTLERNEWLKIQGRFEEISFTESASQMIQLIGRVIVRRSGGNREDVFDRVASSWFGRLSKNFSSRLMSADVLSRSLPLHPVSIAVLPELFARYAQNDRSLFSFLTSNEPDSLRRFLDESTLSGSDVPLFKLDRVYDYFIHTSLSSLILQPNFQRWIELKQIIDDHEGVDPDTLSVLKTIGILNLANTTGTTRASRELTILALCNSPADKREARKWETLIDTLIVSGRITYRRQLDELRLWEGSDFDFDASIAASRQKLHFPLSHLLERSHPPRIIVAQKHSYQSGAIRHFETRYFDRNEQFLNLAVKDRRSTGLIGYWVADGPPRKVPTVTTEGKPFVLILGREIERLRSAAREHAALGDVFEASDNLKSDSVARREVRYRLLQAKYLLDETINSSICGGDTLEMWLDGKVTTVRSGAQLNAVLSSLCDRIFSDRIVLWNELINKDELTSQGAKARREVIERILLSGDKKDLGLSGNGPAMSVYQSVLKNSGLHRQGDSHQWEFGRPAAPGFQKVWDHIEAFCMNAGDDPQKIHDLFETLQQPPYGVKVGVMPLLLATVLVAHSDSIGVYENDRFIPQLGSEHFELLVKDPARFSVKHYHVAGVRAEVFRQLESVVTESIELPAAIRNRTLLGVATPLLRFVRRLPVFSKSTERISKRAQAVRTALLDAPEPDNLLFCQLPVACGLKPIDPSEAPSGSDLPKLFGAALAGALREIRESYDRLLSDCRQLLYQAFGVKQSVEYLREDLRVRASYLEGRSLEPVLSRFIRGAVESNKSDHDWLQAMLMIIVDKPVDVWTDRDLDAYEVKLADIARRFTHIEAISKGSTKLWNSSAEARRISIVRTNGTTRHCVDRRK
ncbi:MAG: hypothetical protein ABL984_03235 [Pyrinomonadaceae bacterium]